MYPYEKYSDETEVTFSNIYIENDIECIDVHFERPTENGFDSVRIQLPTYKMIVWEGNYSEKFLSKSLKIVRIYFINMHVKEVLNLPSIFENYRIQNLFLVIFYQHITTFIDVLFARNLHE